MKIALFISLCLFVYRSAYSLESYEIGIGKKFTPVITPDSVSSQSGVSSSSSSKHVGIIQGFLSSSLKPFDSLPLRLGITAQYGSGTDQGVDQSELAAGTELSIWLPLGVNPFASVGTYLVKGSIGYDYPINSEPLDVKYNYTGLGLAFCLGVEYPSSFLSPFAEVQYLQQVIEVHNEDSANQSGLSFTGLANQFLLGLGFDL
jgi:hypothetical protein